MSRLYLSNPCALFRYFQHTVLRAQSAPGFPCALFKESDNESAQPGQNQVAGMYFGVSATPLAPVTIVS
jgi:hypothetical protein